MSFELGKPLEQMQAELVHRTRVVEDATFLNPARRFLRDHPQHQLQTPWYNFLLNQMIQARIRQALTQRKAHAPG